ncbi:MAG: tRNA guanosine(34) transglycosylase Tgt, partial [Alphaproteobacteria bacterium]|nr:tRNA guanosine(34) transglycosylase Tgt [Alphaproteobacteria bacterium]
PITSCYSRAYLHHLFKSKEMLAGMITTHINLNYYNSIMVELRDAIFTQKLDDAILNIYENWDKQENI